MSRRSIIQGFMNKSFTDVVIIAGQSNARGNTGGVAPVFPYLLPNPKALIAGVDISSSNERSSFEVMDYSTGNFMGFLHASEPSIAFEYVPRDVRIIKVVEGGTNLAWDWRSGSVLRNKLIDYINYAKNNVENPRFIFYWDQWENDAPNDEYSDAYESNYQGFISEILASTGIVMYKHIIHKVNVNSAKYTDNVANGNKIILAQNNNAILYNADILETNDLPLHDTTHYTSLGNIEIGKRIVALI